MEKFKNKRPSSLLVAGKEKSSCSMCVCVCVGVCVGRGKK